MLLQVRLAAVARLAAALLAVTLSGAPRVLAMHAPEEGHRCSCRAQRGDHHECECAICRKAMLTALASDESAPPCHRTAARRALSESAPAGSRGGPCLEGTCGGSGPQTMTAAGVEPFCLPSSKAVALVQLTERVARAPERGLERPHEPATPRPRAA